MVLVRPACTFNATPSRAYSSRKASGLGWATCHASRRAPCGAVREGCGVSSQSITKGTRPPNSGDDRPRTRQRNTVPFRRAARTSVRTDRLQTELPRSLGESVEVLSGHCETPDLGPLQRRRSSTELTRRRSVRVRADQFQVLGPPEGQQGVAGAQVGMHAARSRAARQARWQPRAAPRRHRARRRQCGRGAASCAIS